MPDFLHIGIQEAPRIVEVTALLVGMFYMAREFREDSRSRQITNLIQITEGYRELWSQMYSNPELARVISSEVDLHKSPITPEEDRFVRSLINHLSVSFQASQVQLFMAPENLRDDVSEFFNLPIPHAVWLGARSYQDRRFADFVDCCIRP